MCIVCNSSFKITKVVLKDKRYKLVKTYNTKCIYKLVQMLIVYAFGIRVVVIAAIYALRVFFSDFLISTTAW
jgi:hypothetical protein